MKGNDLESLKTARPSANRATGRWRSMGSATRSAGQRAGRLLRALAETVAAHAWTVIALAVTFMLSVAILVAAFILRPQPQRYRYETVTYQRNGFTRQTIYKIDTETGRTEEVVNSSPRN